MARRTSSMMVTADQLIREPIDLRPHVVVIGAGASRAACPNGDANGRLLPVMADLVQTLDLTNLLSTELRPFAACDNFEDAYSSLCEKPHCAENVKEVERRVYAYFSELELPATATIYDRMLLSLRSTDVVFTFNWDPFLFDAYTRNRGVVPLPGIFFLHGNVRIGCCPQHHQVWGHRIGRCSICGVPYVAVPLLYPIRTKDYSTNPYIAGAWENARVLIEGAFTMTVFGYGAPTSDVDAVDLLRSSWLARNASIAMRQPMREFSVVFAPRSLSQL